MQHRAPAGTQTHFRDFLPDVDALAFADEKRAIMTIGAQVVFIVFDDQELPVSGQAAARVNHLAARGRDYRLTIAPTNLHARFCFG